MNRTTKLPILRKIYHLYPQISKSFLAEWEERGHNPADISGGNFPSDLPWYCSRGGVICCLSIYNFQKTKHLSTKRDLSRESAAFTINDKYMVWIKKISAFIVRYNLDMF